LYNQAGHGQWLCWHRPELHHLKFERRDWCRAELKKRFNYIVNSSKISNLDKPKGKPNE